MQNVTEKQLKTAAKVTFEYLGEELTLENRTGLCYLVSFKTHLVNVKSITRYGINWYTFLLGKRVKGYIKISETKLLTVTWTGAGESII